MLTIRCSGLARPMTCAGSLFFKDLPEPEEIEAARQGTAAGEVLERTLLGQDIPNVARNGYVIEQDMFFHTKPIAQAIFDRAEGEVRCEQRIDWLTRSGIKIAGSYDAGYVTDAGRTLNIDDLKYGWGLVEVKENWQLLGYAIGEVIRRQQHFETIVMRIHQPRPHHEDGSSREWRISYKELIEYKERIEARCDEIANGDKTLVTSAKCKYCPAAVACPAMNKAFYRGVEVVHEFLQDNIDEKELSYQLDLVARVEELVKIKKDSLKALAIDRLKKGAIIPNYIADGSYGDRKWKSHVNPEIIKALTGKDVVVREMLSPAQAEKIGVSKTLVNALVDRHFLGSKLVRKDSTALGNKIFGQLI